MKTISLRLPEPMLNRLKVLANEHDVPLSIALEHVSQREDCSELSCLHCKTCDIADLYGLAFSELNRTSE